MATKYKFTRTQTVTVSMADDGEDYEGEPVKWDSKDAQREGALEWADGTFLEESYCEDFMEAETTPWKEVRG